MPRLLILAPHVDDGEFGCGGSIAKLVEEGWEAHYVAFSSCQTSLPDHLPPDILVCEVKEATEVLGIKPQHLQVLDFEVRRFPELRQEILEYMVRLKADIKPDLVFMPSKDDTHQDHQQVAQEGFRAFKTTRMLGYEMPWNNLEFSTTAFTLLEERHVEKKVEAMRCYRSQADRFYATGEFIRSLARTRGVQIAQPYAEAFQVFRWLL
ncbi:PIG-L family deacetylase [Myxococcota bacterium]|nr:PIG-L family deacetylase [Myxococcota bacterium]MBU1429570.1 PIG-L family deacetylase [Myxococcota bacterium]MBU1900588.1 PIG-L family deacetylase [Myxococcota bacterium]